MAPSEKKSSKHSKKDRKSDSSITLRVQKSDPSVDPIVVSFPGGVPSSPPTFTWEKGPRGDGRILKGKDSTCTYQASSEGLGYDGRRTKLCVGVYDKKRGVLKIHPAASKGHVYELAQSVEGYQMEETNQGLSGWEKQQALFEDFGSARRKKALKSQRANLVDVDHVVGAGKKMVDTILDNQTESNRLAIQQARQDDNDDNKETLDAAAVAANQARTQLLPKYNLNAKKPHLVYNAEDIAGMDAWANVTRIVEACHRHVESSDYEVDNMVEALTTPPPHASRPQQYWNPSIVTALKLASDKSLQTYKIALLLNHWINLYVKIQGRRFISAPDDGQPRLFGVPMEVAGRYLELFMTPSVSEDGNRAGFATSRAQKDKCLVHLLLLFLMLHGTSMTTHNLHMVAEDLKLPVMEASQMIRQAGCNVQKVGSKTTATLTVPLTFPSHLKRKRRR